MNCPRCQALVAAEDVSLEHLIAKCRSCQEVFRFSPSEIEAVTEREHQREAFTEVPLDPVPDIDIRLPSVGLKAPRPASIEIEDWGPNRRLVKRWFNSSYVGTALFCVFWDGFLIFWYSMAFSTGNLLMTLFPILHLGVGVWITYSTIAGFFNRTIITLDEGELSVVHGPIPWLGNVTLSAAGIEQLYCMEAQNWSNRRQVYRPVTVHALLASGKSVQVVRSLPRDEALFIEQQLEEWLEIKPRRVPGQVD